MLSETKGVFGPHDLTRLQSSFDDAWAKLMGSHTPLEAAEEQNARVRLGRIIVRLYSANEELENIGEAAALRYQNTDIRGYLVEFVRYRST